VRGREPSCAKYLLGTSALQATDIHISTCVSGVPHKHRGVMVVGKALQLHTAWPSTGDSDALESEKQKKHYP